jgi:hypothetical protein
MRPALPILSVVVLLSSCSALGPSPQSKSPAGVSNMTVLVGQRFLDEDDWEPVEEPLAVSVEFDHYGRFDPAGFEIGFSYAEDSGDVGPVEIDSQIWELYGGVRKTFSLAEDRLHPYISAGMSWSNAEVDASAGGLSSNIDDDALGFYLRGGVYYTFGGGLNLGLDYRKLLGADFDAEGASADGDFDQFSLSLGYSF